MSIVITVKNLMNKKEVRMEIESTDSVGDIINSASEYWKNDVTAYVMKKGKKILPSMMDVATAGIVDGDVLELIPDPEGGSQ